MIPKDGILRYKTVPVKLDPEAHDALSKLAYREYRDVQKQAGIVIRDELIRLGLLNYDDNEVKSEDEK